MVGMEYSFLRKVKCLTIHSEWQYFHYCSEWIFTRLSEKYTPRKLESTPQASRISRKSTRRPAEVVRPSWRKPWTATSALWCKRYSRTTVTYWNFPATRSLLCGSFKRVWWCATSRSRRYRPRVSYKSISELTSLTSA